jgi:DNA-directed RNA polymerase subunit omega
MSLCERCIAIAIHPSKMLCDLGLLHCKLNKRKGTTHVISPRIDRLLEQVDSNYAGVIVAAKRARQINSYYHNLGEGTFDEFPPPMVETASKNYLTIALEEVAAGKMKYHYR